MSEDIKKVIANVVDGKHSEYTSTLGFTKGQQAAYDSLLEFINSEYDPKDYKRALVGYAGTGKTYLIKALIKNCNLSYSVINLAAPTHKVCRILSESIKLSNVRITTMASDLGFKPNYDSTKFDINNPPFDQKNKPKILEYKPKLYIMDEASMIGRGEQHYIEKFCKAVNCKIIYIGDEKQLPPVEEKYSPTLRNIKTYKLTEIVRQEEDNPVRHLLDLLRFDVEHKTYSFLEFITKNPSIFDDDGLRGYCVMSGNRFNNQVYTTFNDEKYTSNIDLARIIAYTNDKVTAWNKFVREAIVKDSDTSIITKNDLILSYTTIVDEFNASIIENSEEYVIKDIVNYVHPTYRIKGFLVTFIAIHGGAVTKPLFILDHSDRFSLEMYCKITQSLISTAKSASNNTRATCWKEYFKFRDNCLLLTNIIGSNNKKLYTKNLDYGFALTAHKSQGSTFDTVLVDVNDIVFDKFGHVYTNTEEVNRRLYVACSRAKNKLFLNYGM